MTSLHGKRKSGKRQSQRLPGGGHGNSPSQSDGFLRWCPRHLPLSLCAPHTMKVWCYHLSLHHEELWLRELKHRAPVTPLARKWQDHFPQIPEPTQHLISSTRQCVLKLSRADEHSSGQSPRKGTWRRVDAYGCQSTCVETSGDWCALHILGRTYFT